MTAMAPLASLMTRSALAQQNGAPLRSIFLFHPNGCVPDIWFPKAGTMNLPAMTAPLENVKDHLLFLDGIGFAGNANTHEGGTAKCLRGQGGQTSIDVQFGKEDFANRSQTLISVPSLQMGVGTQWGDGADKRISSDNGQGLHPEDNPNIVYPRVFGGESPSAGGGSSSITQANMLSTALEDLKRMRQTLGAEESQKIEQHMDAMNVLEQKIDAANNVGSSAGMADPSAACTMGPDIGAVAGKQRSALWSKDILETVSDIQQDILVQALSCNITRTAAFSYGVSVSPLVVPGTSITDHLLSHESPEKHTTSKIWWMAEVGKLIQKLASTPDVNGSLLDNTVIVTVSDLGHGNYHNHYRIPMLLAGGKNVGLKTGRSVDLRPYGTKKVIGDQNANDPSINHADVLTTIGEKLGYQDFSIPTTEGRIENVWAGGDMP